MVFKSWLRGPINMKVPSVEALLLSLLSECVLAADGQSAEGLDLSETACSCKLLIITDWEL